MIVATRQLDDPPEVLFAEEAGSYFALCKFSGLQSADDLKYTVNFHAGSEHLGMSMIISKENIDLMANVTLPPSLTLGDGVGDMIIKNIQFHPYYEVCGLC